MESENGDPTENDDDPSTYVHWTPVTKEGLTGELAQRFEERNAEATVVLDVD